MKWRAEVLFRFGDDFEKKPYFSCHLSRIVGFSLQCGWLWFRLNVSIWKQKTLVVRPGNWPIVFKEP